MPRYFFHVQDDHSEPDLEGTDLPDIQTARQTAIRYAGEILNDEAHRVALGDGWRMEVTDARGLVQFRLDFHVTDVPARPEHLREVRAARGAISEGGADPLESAPPVDVSP